MAPTRSEIESLLFLLDDPDPFIQDNVRSRLYELGEHAVPLLDERKSETRDNEERDRINEIIHSITFSSLEEDFLELLDQGVDSLRGLEDAIILLARFGNPTLRESEVKRKLNRYADMVRDDIRYTMHDSDKMRRLLDFVFEDLHFRGDTENYHDPANSFIDQVLERRKGLPITLALIVLFLARRLELPFTGVNMPIHFMLKFESERQNVLIDPFDAGNMVTYDQCYYFLKKNGVDPKAEHFEDARPIEILARCLRNLIHSYAKKQASQRVEQLRELLNAVESRF